MRRIEALAGDAARHYLETRERQVSRIAGLLKSALMMSRRGLPRWSRKAKNLERELADVKKKLAMGGGASGASAIEDIGGVKLLARVLDRLNPKDLRW